jgi:peptidoglycan/xylan/chitin deacetylase (PgdA/CDA1 family)
MIDDGPSANTTRLLQILADKGVKANFDLVGSNCSSNPSAVTAINAAGHSILNHSQNHLTPASASTADLTADIVDCQTSIQNITGTAPTWYWPPYIALDSRHAAILSANNLTMCKLSTLVGSADYDTNVTAEEIKTRSISLASDGALLLFHEWRSESLDVLPEIIDTLRAQGFVFISYDEMDAYLDTK